MNLSALTTHLTILFGNKNKEPHNWSKDEKTGDLNVKLIKNIVFSF